MVIHCPGGMMISDVEKKPICSADAGTVPCSSSSASPAEVDFVYARWEISLRLVRNDHGVARNAMQTRVCCSIAPS